MKTKKSVKTKKDSLIIDRKRWLRGEQGCNASKLFRSEDKKMCCLGFFARKCGYTIKEIRNVYAPQDCTLNKFPGWLVFKGVNTDIGVNLMTINDGVGMDNKVREKKIIKVFKKKGISVVFK